MDAFVEVVKPDGTQERYPVEGAQVTLGKSGTAGISIPTANELAYDPGNTYSIPYAWGTTGLCYRSDLVAEEPDSWYDLLTPAEDVTGKTTMLFTERWLMLPAQKALGFSVNTTDEAEMQQVKDLLIQAKPTLLAYDDRGWSRRVVRKRAITAQQANEALTLAKAGGGDLLVSKCPFPRHAVVFMDGDVPVASVNVCFSCGDVLLWPEWPGRTLKENATDIELKRFEIAQQKVEALHAKTYPKWKVFFRDGLAMPLEWSAHSRVR